MNLNDLKNNRKSYLEKLAAAADTLSSNKQVQEDNRFWKLTVDAAGNGSAIIRFLPACAGEEIPFVRYWSHGFKGPGGWYIENSLTSIGLPDPVSEYNSRLWNEDGSEAAKKMVREQKRRLHYISNIFVISDPANPSNEGKVFLFQYGKKIFDMIKSKLHPEFEDEEPVQVFDLWEGANFRLRARNVDGYRNYDKSSFDSPSPLSNDDKELERIWSLTYSLQEFLSPKNFKTYEELQARLNKVLGLNSAGRTTTELESSPAWTPPSSDAPSAPTSFEKKSEPWSEDDDDDDMDSLKYFQSLAK